MSCAFRSVALFLGLAVVCSARADDAVAYTNVALETAGKAGRIDKGTLVIRGGKIEAVGPNVTVPEGARVVDAQGKTIMPGIVDPFHEVNIAGAGGDAAPRTIVIGGRNFNLGGAPTRTGGTFTRVADNFYPYEAGYRAMVRSGLTELNLVTAGYGQAAVIHLTPAQPEGMLVNPDGYVFTAVANETSSLDVVRTALETAERVKKGEAVNLPSVVQAAPEQKAAPFGKGKGKGGKGKGGGRPGGFGGFTPGLTPTTLKLWQGVHEGKTPLFANVSNAAAIVHLLKLLEPYKDVKLVLVAPGQALYETLDHLASRPLRLIVKTGLSLKPNTRDRISVAGLLQEAGLEFSFTHAGNQNEMLATQDFPLFSVAYLVRCGLPRKAALEALTARPAALLGLDKTHGTLEPGKSADLLIFTGDPLDPNGQLAQVLIEGKTVYEN